MLFINRMLLMGMLFSNGALFCMEGRQLSFPHYGRSNKKANVNTVYMLQAVAENDMETVRSYLDDKRVSVNAQDMYKVDKDQIFKTMNALMVAAFHGHEEMVKFLLNRKVQLHRVNEYGDTALMIAARTGRVGVVRELLNARANVHRQNKKGNTALQEAENSLLRCVQSHEIQHSFSEVMSLLHQAENQF